MCLNTINKTDHFSSKKNPFFSNKKINYGFSPLSILTVTTVCFNPYDTERKAAHVHKVRAW